MQAILSNWIGKSFRKQKTLMVSDGGSFTG